MKRLCVFVFYDKEGIVDSYIEYLLNDLKKCLNYLIIAVNGEVNDYGRKILEKYASQIVVRENRGFDAGAYKEILINVLGKEEIKKWDEIVLCNDTFYGPFVSFKDIFNKMNQKRIDFWGLNYIDNGFMSHIQSYFLVFRKDILINGDLLEYMEKYIHSNNRDISEVYAVFEVGLFSYLKRKGYKYDTFTFNENYNIYSCADICIEKFQFPILKKRCFCLLNYNEKYLGRLLEYIRLEYVYDISLITQNVYRLYRVKIKLNGKSYNQIADASTREKDAKCVKEDRILKFMQEYSDIYIYGTGIFAKHIWFKFHSDIKKFKGFIVSDKEEIEQDFLYHYPVKHYKDVEENISIIVGMGFKNSREIFWNLKEKDNILFLWEDIMLEYETNNNLQGDQMK